FSIGGGDGPRRPGPGTTARAISGIFASAGTAPAWGEVSGPARRIRSGAAGASQSAREAAPVSREHRRGTGCLATGHPGEHACRRRAQAGTRASTGETGAAGGPERIVVALGGLAGGPAADAHRTSGPARRIVPPSRGARCTAARTAAGSRAAAPARLVRAPHQPAHGPQHSCCRRPAPPRIEEVAGVAGRLKEDSGWRMEDGKLLRAATF